MGWGDGSVVNSTACPSKGHEFNPESSAKSKLWISKWFPNTIIPPHTITRHEALALMPASIFLARVNNLLWARKEGQFEALNPDA